MKKFFYFSIVLLFTAGCVELPNLIPDDVNGESDMFVYDLGVDILSDSFTWPLVIDDNLTLDAFEVTNVGICGNMNEYSNRKLTINNGQVLAPKNFTEDPNIWLTGAFYDGLTNGELVNGFSTTTEWKNDFYLYIMMQVYIFCVDVPSLNTEAEAYVGFKFKIDTKWHYGWILFESNALLENGIDYGYLIKKVAYNKNAGTNVRIGG